MSPNQIYSFLRSSDFIKESKSLLKLALPILLAQFALTGLGVVDTVMSGWVSTQDLAAIGLGSNIMLPVFIFSTGVLLALTPLVARAHNRQESSTVGLYLSQGLWLAIPLGLLSILVLVNMDILLEQLNLEPKVFALTSDYLLYISIGLPGVALYQVLRFFWEGMEQTLPTMWISFIALFMNIPLNAVFIYGFGPVEAMGAAGCGVASAIVMWSMFFIGLAYVFKNKHLAVFFKLKNGFSLTKWQWQEGIQPILKLGLPNSLALLFEVGMFSFIALFIAVLGSTVIAAHQIAISFTSLAFMIPLSFAMAITVRMGKSYGMSDANLARQILITGFSWAILIGTLLALISFFLRNEIVALYSFDDNVIKLATTLLIFAAMYQVFDAVQVTAAGALRGLHDTKITMWVTLLSYWGIGLGLGYIMTFTDLITPVLGVAGFWLGIVLGLSLAAILLSLRLRVMFNVTFKS